MGCSDFLVELSFNFWEHFSEHLLKIIGKSMHVTKPGLEIVTSTFNSRTLEKVTCHLQPHLCHLSANCGEGARKVLLFNKACPDGWVRWFCLSVQLESFLTQLHQHLSRHTFLCTQHSHKCLHPCQTHMSELFRSNYNPSAFPHGL
jgi:hypothetical protein